MLAVTLPPDPYSDASSAAPESVQSSPALARSVTEGLRQLAASALLAGNGVLLFLGVSNLLFVVTDWITRFGARSESVFDTFAGPVAIALPLLAMLLATHVNPVLPQSRVILQVALVQYAVSGFFGVVTYLGSFAEGVFSVRSTVNGLISRAVWLAFLAIAAMAVYRVYRTVYPPMPRSPYGYGPAVYGRPYPGQPTYPRPGNYSSVHGPADPAAAPPVRYEPGVAGHGGHGGEDATVRMTDPAAEATRLIPPVPAQPSEPATAPLPPAAPLGDTAAPGGTPER